MSEYFGTLPKYISIAAQYRAQIESGALRPGDRLPSFAEVRSQLGVGQSTLEKAHELLMQESLIRREPGRGIFVAPRRQRPKLGVVGLLGIDAVKGHHPYFARLLEGVQQVAYRAGTELLLLHENSVVTSHKVDGILLYSPYPDVALRRLPAEIPCVSLLTGARGVSSVVVNHAEGIALAVRHLVKQGHRRIAYLSGWPQNDVVQGRVATYRASLREADIAPGEDWLFQMPYAWAAEQGIETYRSYVDWGFRAMNEWLAQGWEELGFTALLAHNDDTAAGAARALSEAGWQIPDQVSLVGYDDTLSAELMHPQLTTVHVPLFQVGARAMEMLLHEIDADATSAPLVPEVTFPSELKVRASTAIPASLNVIAVS